MGQVVTETAFIDLDHALRCKQNQSICGDVFHSHRIKEEGRVLAVLSDGLGSGVKASVLANLTASMALKFASTCADTRIWARSIMDTLPICEVRKISYSTFTLIDLDESGTLRFIEHGNPPLVLLRGTEEIELHRSVIRLERWQDRLIYHGRTRLQIGDRLICFSDGISQSGMGRQDMPFGWTQEEAVAFARGVIKKNPKISSRRLTAALMDQALINDRGHARDDISCAVVHFRVPRQLLIMTGPPFVPQRDFELAQAATSFPGRKIICGGTTATIIGRILQRPATVDLTQVNTGMPPPAKMEGIDLITEGSLTLAHVAQILASDFILGRLPANPAGDIIRLMLGSDIIHFIVGTRINEAHQDPNTPQELDLRRNIVRRIVSLLEEKYFNSTSVRFL
ncbi:MAG: SpoIIE family protein phosphatase [Desulfobulbus sp.]|nr:SpoIIE family protein phosphatase [Desulfobulbus sp.]